MAGREMKMYRFITRVTSSKIIYLGWMGERKKRLTNKQDLEGFVVGCSLGCKKLRRSHKLPRGVDGLRSGLIRGHSRNFSQMSGLATLLF